MQCRRQIVVNGESRKEICDDYGWSRGSGNVMILYKRIGAWLLLLCLSLFNTCVLASGAFFPHLGSLGDNEYNLGKAVYSGRVGPRGCIDCHENFDRSRLMKLNQPVSELVSNCDLHKPCIDSLNDKQSKVLDLYIKRRYHLK